MDTSASHQADPRRWIALGVVLAASFMILLDVSIVNVAIPSIRADLHATYAQIELVLAGYQLAYAVALITGGRLGDIFGRKRLFIIGVTGFTLASAACGFAPSAGWLVISRVIQGLMAALMYPQVLSVIQVSFPPRERGTAFGVFGATIGVATISGPLLGGLLIKLDLLGQHWRPIFLINIPVGVAAVLAAVVWLHESRAPSATRLDLPGMALATIALFLLVYPLVEGRDAGWPSWTFICLATAAVVFAIFALYIPLRARRSGSPLVEPELFSDRAFVIGTVVAAAFFSSIPAFFLTFSLFLQIGVGFDALHAGLTTIPFAIGSAIASGVSVRLAPKIGKNILLVGSGLLIAGLAALYGSLQLLGTGFTGYELIPALTICGIGLGCVVAPLINLILAGIHHGNAGSAAGLLTTMQQVGGALGVAVIGIVFFGALGSHADRVNADRAPTLTQRVIAAGVPPPSALVIVKRFDICFRDRSNATDPTATTPTCRVPQPAARTRDVLAQEAHAALGDDFLYAFQRALLYEMAILIVVFALVFALPAAGVRELGPA